MLSASSLARINVELSGVRNSWLMLARNSLLYWLDRSSSVALSVDHASATRAARPSGSRGSRACSSSCELVCSSSTCCPSSCACDALSARLCSSSSSLLTRSSSCCACSSSAWRVRLAEQLLASRIASRAERIAIGDRRRDAGEEFVMIGFDRAAEETELQHGEDRRTIRAAPARSASFARPTAWPVPERTGHVVRQAGRGSTGACPRGRPDSSRPVASWRPAADASPRRRRRHSRRDSAACRRPRRRGYEPTRPPRAGSATGSSTRARRSRRCRSWRSSNTRGNPGLARPQPGLESRVRDRRSRQKPRRRGDQCDRSSTLHRRGSRRTRRRTASWNSRSGARRGSTCSSDSISATMRARPDPWRACRDRS